MKLFVLWSGGVDSTYWLWRYLQEGHEVSAHHVNMKAESSNNEVQLERIDAMVEWIRGQGYELPMTGAEVEIWFGGRIEDMPVVTSSAGWVMGAMKPEDRPDYWVNGWCMEDGMRRIIEQMPRAAGVIEALSGVPELIPDIVLPKRIMLKELPDELAALAWSCREPGRNEKGEYLICGKCEPCKILENGYG